MGHGGLVGGHRVREHDGEERHGAQVQVLGVQVLLGGVQIEERQELHRLIPM